MPVTFVDQFMAYIATTANLTTFLNTVGLAAYAGTSFTRRYGQNGFEVDSVVLGTPKSFQLQELVLDDLRLTGTEQRSDAQQRKIYDLRYHRQEQIGWVDASFTTQADFNAHAIPGSFQLGTGAGVTQQGVSSAPPPASFLAGFQLTLSTDPFTLSYPLRVYLFASADLAPTADLRRIREIRTFLESDPAYLKSLDGSPDQRPLLFAQIYSGTAADGGPIATTDVAAMFDADDILAAFFTIPA